MRFRIDVRRFHQDVAQAAIEFSSSIHAIAVELQIDAATFTKLKSAEGSKVSAAIVLPVCRHLGLDPFAYIVDTDPD